mgnify:CR=1 FL=1
MATARKSAKKFADQILREQREELKKKQDAAVTMSSALFRLRDAAKDWHDAAAVFAKLNGMSQNEMRKLLDLTSTEANIAFDTKHAHVRENPNESDGHETERHDDAAIHEPVAESNEPDDADTVSSDNGLPSNGEDNAGSPDNNGEFPTWR